MVTVSESQSPEAVAESVDLEGQRQSDFERALGMSACEDMDAFVETAVREYVDDLLAGEGTFECPHDGCEETFDFDRQRRGHLGAVHAQETPDGDFWCGICGYGPSTWRGVNAHHGSTSHEGEPVRLEEPPDPEDLQEFDAPDHKNPKLLQQLYDEHDGQISELCRDHEFDVVHATVRTWLIKFGIHEVTPQSDAAGSRGVIDADQARELYAEHDGNMSAVHRNLDQEIPYRTLVNRLRSLGIHDPAESSRAPASQSAPSNISTDTAEEDVATTAVERVDDAAVDSVDYPIPDAVRLTSVRDADTVSGFSDIDTPDWLDEGTFYAVLDTASSIDEFAETLGWGTPDDLRLILDLLDERVEG